MSQTLNNVSLEDRFIGCLLGLAVGDALGGCFEGQTAGATFPSLSNAGSVAGRTAV